MAEARTRNLFDRIDQAELAVCMLINRSAHRAPVCGFFALMSRLGNGVFWYAMLASIPLLYGRDGVVPTVHMGIVALIGVVIYKVTKHRLVRERPFISWPTIHCGSPPLDRYSFPSGHTLHAVAFAVLVMYHVPDMGWVVLPFAVLVSLSRVILGLHYPSDVVAGAAIGGGLATASLYVLDLLQYSGGV